jgi:hypothetical protein
MAERQHKTLKRPLVAEKKEGNVVVEPSETATVGTTVATVATVPTTGTTGTSGTTGTGTSIFGDQRSDPFRNLLDESARDAFRRPWHRLERGLRLNRLRMYVEEVSAQCSFVQDEKDRFFAFLQNALDRKLLNTHKIVEYLPELQKIKTIKGLEVRRTPTGEAKWGFIRVKKAEGTRRVRRVQEKLEENEHPPV